MSDYLGGGLGLGTGSTAGRASYDVAEEERIGRRIGLLEQYAPEIGATDPAMVLELATARDDDDRMVQNAIDTIGFVGVQRRVEQLRQEAPDLQRAIYGQYPEAMQTALRSAGYVVPEVEDRDDGGILTGFGINLPDKIPFVGDLLPGGGLPDRLSVDGPVGALLGAPQHLVGEGLQAVGHGFEIAGRLPAHLYRMEVEAEGGLLNQLWRNPTGLGRLWSMTGDGEEYLPADRRRALEDRYGRQVVEAALHLSGYGGNRSLEEIAKDRWNLRDDDPALGQRVLELYEAQQNPDVQAAMADVEGQRVSPGRDLARSLGLDPTQGPGKWVSGGLDAAFTVALDPTNIAGGIIAKARYGRYAFAAGTQDAARLVDQARAVRALGGTGIVTPRRLLTREGRQLDRGASMLRWAEHVADNVTTPHRLWRDQPELLPLWDKLMTWRADPTRRPLTTVDGVLDFLASTDGQAALVATAAGGRHVTRQLPTMPHLSRIGAARIGASRRFDDTLRASLHLDVQSRVRATDDYDEIAKVLRYRTAERLGWARDAIDRNLGRIGVDVDAWRQAEEAAAAKLTDRTWTLDQAVAELADQFTTDPQLARLALDVAGPGATQAGLAAAASELARTTALRAATGPGRFLWGLTRHAPYTNVQLTANGPEAFAQFDRFANVLEALGAPSARVDVWRDAFAGVEIDGDGVRRLVGTNQAVRSAVVESAITELFDYLPVPADLLERFTGRLRHVYSPSGNDAVRLRGGFLNRDLDSRGALFLDSQGSAAMALPDIGELLRLTHGQTITRQLLHNAPATWANAKYGRLWKPAVLLRLGFIIRAAGEESLNFVLQHGPRAWLQAKGAEWIARDLYVRDLDDTLARDLLRDGDRAIAEASRREAIRSSALAPLRSLVGLWEDWTRTVLGRPLDASVVRQLRKTDPDLADQLTTWQGIDALTPAQRARVRRTQLSWQHRLALWDPHESAAHNLAASASGFMHELVRDTRIPSKADVARAVLRPDDELIFAARLMLTDDVVQRIAAERAAAGTFQIGDVFGSLASGGPRTTTAVSLEGGQVVLRDLLVRTSRSDFTIASRLEDYANWDANEFADFYVGHLRRIDSDEVLGPVLADVLPRFVDDRTLDELATVSDAPAADLLRAVEADARRDGDVRTLLQRWADGDLEDLDPEELAEELAVLGRADTGDTLRRAIESGDLSARTRWLLATKFADDWDVLAGTAELRRLLAAKMQRAYADPRHAQLLRSARLAHYGDGMPTFTAPIPDHTIGVYTPAVATLADDAYDRIVAKLAGTDYDGPAVARAVVDARFDRADPTARWTDATVAPASRWVTSDPELAQLLAEALGADRLVLGHLPTSAVGRGGWAGQHLRGVAGGWQLDAPWFARFDAPADTVRKVRLKVVQSDTGEVATGWVDELDYTPDMGEVVETRIVGGNPDQAVLEALAAKQADEALRWYTTFERTDRAPAVLHELHGPARARRPVELPDGDTEWVGGLDRRHLAGADREDLPTEAFGPSRVLASEATWDRFVRQWFDGPVGQAMGAIIRKPIFLHAMARSLKNHRGLMANFVDPKLDAKAGKILARLGRDADLDEIKDRAALLWDEIFAQAAGVEFDPRRTVLLQQVEEAFAGTTKWEQGADRLAQALGLDDWADAEAAATGVAGDTAAARFAATRRGRRTGMAEADPRWITEEEFHVLRQALAQRQNALHLIRQNSLEAAVKDVVPYIDDHRVRSIFQEYVGNFVPFWFAEEAFLKRWARTIAERPEVLRRMQLLMHGFRSSGVVRSDGDGNEYFVYPLSGEALAITKPVLRHLFGNEAAALVPAQLTGDIRYVLPGFGDQMGVPSFGPLVGLTLELASRRYPEIGDMEQRLLGDRGSDRSVWHYMFPSQMVNLVQTYINQDDTEAQLHSATIQAAQTLLAGGHGPPPNATPAEMEEFTDRVRDTARVALGFRALFAFGAPSSPQIEWAGSEQAREFTELLSSGVPYEEAFAAFIEAHPDATPFTVFGTEMDAPQRAVTTEAYQWMLDNESLIEQFPGAAPWLLPMRGTDDVYDRRARAQQLAGDLRRRRGIDEFVEEVYFAEAAGDYFDAQDTYEGLIDAAVDDVERRQLRDEWSRFSTAYRNLHPVFANQLVDPERQQRRFAAIRDMRLAVEAHPDVVPEGMGELLDLLDDYRLRRQALTGLRSGLAEARKDELDASFAGTAFDLVRRHPQLRPFFDRVIRPDLDAIEDTGAVEEVA